MKKLINKSAFNDIVGRVERNHEVFEITKKLGSLSLHDHGASSSGAISSGTGLLQNNSSSFISTLTPTASILERFKMRSNPSAFTRKVIDLTKAPFFDIQNPIMKLTEKPFSYMMSLGFRFMPGQGEFLVKELRSPETLEGLRNLRDNLGLSLTKGTLSSSPLLRLKGLSDSVQAGMSALASRVLVEAITYNAGYYGRFLILVQIGLGCTVWYGFAPGDGHFAPTEGFVPLFSPIDNYDAFITNPDVHVQPGFNKITFVQGVDNVAAPLSQAFTEEKPFMDIDIEMPTMSNKSLIVGVSLGLAVALLFTLGVNPSCGEGIIG